MNRLELGNKYYIWGCGDRSYLSNDGYIIAYSTSDNEVAIKHHTNPMDSDKYIMLFSMYCLKNNLRLA